MKALLLLLALSASLYACRACSPTRTRQLASFRPQYPGVYVIALTISPAEEDVQVQFYEGGLRLFTAYAVNNVELGFTVAAPLDEDLHVDYMGRFGNYTFNHWSGYNVSSHTDYLYAQCNGVRSPQLNYLVPFHNSLTYYQTFSHQTQYVFPIRMTGIYWVMIRADCEKGNKVAKIEFRRNSVLQHETECYDDEAMTNSAALYLERYDNVTVMYTMGNSSLESATSLSLAHLQFNTAPYIAYSGYNHWPAYYAAYESLAFGQVMCDYGNMWKSFRAFEIPMPGTYLISVRGAPYEGVDTSINVFQGRVTRPIWTLHFQRGFKSGQTRAIELPPRDFIFLRCGGPDYFVSMQTMFSIAFVGFDGVPTTGAVNLISET